MEEYFGLKPTGRQFREPAANLVELVDPAGLKHTAIVFDEAYRGQPELGLDIELILSFLQHPMVAGLVELSHHDLAQGVFAYPTGPAWTLKELLRIHDDRSKIIGPRAGLELAWLGAQILTEAAATGPQQGCFSHGSLSPWRIALRPDGQVQIFGYGLPQAEIVAQRRDPGVILDADSIRYAPPERLEGQPEELSSDTYALALLTYEAATGRPLFEGHDVSALQASIAGGEAAGLLSSAGLPGPIVELLADALAFDPDTRLTGQPLIDGVGTLLAGQLDGPSLVEILEAVLGQRRQQPRRSARLVSTDTSAYTHEQLASLVDQEDPADEVSSDPRWGRVSRERRAEPAEAAATTATTATTAIAEPEEPRRRRRRRDVEPEAPRRRRRRRNEPQAEATTTEEPPDEPPRAAPDAQTPRERRARSGRDPSSRLRSSTSGQGALSESGRRRRRRSELPAEDTASTEVSADQAPAPAEDTAPEATPTEAPSSDADPPPAGAEAESPGDPPAAPAPPPPPDVGASIVPDASAASTSSKKSRSTSVPKRQRLTRSGATRTSRRRRRSQSPDE